MLGAGEVVLAYPAKLSGAPTVPSRFIQRLAAVAGETAMGGGAASAARRYLAWARELDRPERAPRPVPRPEPKPARDARPTSLSVTEIETWLRDPYSIYARHILQAAAARRHRHAARRARPRHRHPRRDRPLHVAVQGCAAQRRHRRADQARRGGIRRARGFSRGARVLVAAVPAHRALVRRFRNAAPRQCHRHQRGDRRQARDPARPPHLHAAHARRPHRASARRQLRDPRLQDRPAADRAAGIVRSHAATDARRRDPARRTIRRHSGGRIDRRIPLRRAARRRSRRRIDKPIDLRRQHA